MSFLNHRLSFHGSGKKMFAMQLVHLIFIVLTLGIFYPWSRASFLRYVWSETEFAGDRFAFKGTGVELFKGYLVLILVMGLGYAGEYYLAKDVHPFLGEFLFFFFVLLFFPYGLHAALSYMASRITWREVAFRYNGTAPQLMNLCSKGTFLSILTAGIYLPWFTAELDRYLYAKIRIGNVAFKYKGKGKELLLLHLSGILLSVVTLGVYVFWWMNNAFNYYINHLFLVQNGQEVPLRSSSTGSSYFKVYFPNVLLILCTLGLATPWAIARSLRYKCENVEFLRSLNLDTITSE